LEAQSHTTVHSLYEKRLRMTKHYVISINTKPPPSKYFDRGGERKFVGTGYTMKYIYKYFASNPIKHTVLESR